MPRDPRSDAEKARADLARNDEMGLAVPESPAEEGPSATPETFGQVSERGRILREGEGAGAMAPEKQDIGDSTGTMITSRDIPETPQNVEVPPTHGHEGDEDVLSRAKE